jgi:hypothetical protein
MRRFLLKKGAIVQPVRTLANQTLAQWMPQTPQIRRLQQQDQQQALEAEAAQQLIQQQQAVIAASEARKLQCRQNRERRYSATKYWLSSLLAMLVKNLRISANERGGSSSGNMHSTH